MSLRPALPCHVRGTTPTARAQTTPSGTARLDAANRHAPRVGCATRAVAAAEAVHALRGLPPCGRMSAQRADGAVSASRVSARRARCRPATAAAKEAAGATPEVDDETLDQLIAVRALTRRCTRDRRGALALRRALVLTRVRRLSLLPS